MRLRSFLVLAGVLGVIVIALGVTATMVGLNMHRANDRTEQRQEVLESARQTATNMVSIDYRTVDRDLDRILRGTTGQLESDFADRSKNFTQGLGQAKSVSEGSVVSAGVVSMDSDSAEVLVALNSTVKSSQNPKGRAVTYRWSMKLDKVGDRWLASKVDLVP